jgi:hypothetical protein
VHQPASTASSLCNGVIIIEEIILLLEAKFTNQRLRLMTWGQAFGFLDADSHDDDFLDEELRAFLKATLAHLFALFKDGYQLSTRPCLRQQRDPTNDGMFRNLRCQWIE